MEIFGIKIPSLFLMMLLLSFCVIDNFGFILSKFKKPIQFDAYGEIDDYSIVVPIWGDLSYLGNVEYLAKYADRVYLVTTLTEKEEFLEGLKHLSVRYGFRVLQVNTGTQAKSPWLLQMLALNARSQEGHILDSTYTMYLDADTTAQESFAKLAAAMKHNRVDLASVRVHLKNVSNTITQLQELEYQMAMDTRKAFQWLTSGATIAGRTEVLREISRTHSLFFNGGDIENGKLAVMHGYNVRHVNFVTLTNAPDTWRAWYHQRCNWASGAFRHYAANINVAPYRWAWQVFYIVYFIYISLAGKIYGMIHHTELLPFIYLIYVVLNTTLNFGRIKLINIILQPFYSIVQSFLIMPIGGYFYFKKVRQYKNKGFIRPHLDNRNEKVLNNDFVMFASEPMILAKSVAKNSGGSVDPTFTPSAAIAL